MKDAIGVIEPYEIEVQPRDFMYPSEVKKDAEVVGALENGIRSMLGYEPKFSFSTAANDTGLFNFRGIQAVNYGSRDIRFQHTDHDLVSVVNVFNAAKVFAFLGDSPITKTKMIRSSLFQWFQTFQSSKPQDRPRTTGTIGTCGTAVGSRWNGYLVSCFCNIRT